MKKSLLSLGLASALTLASSVSFAHNIDLLTDGFENDETNSVLNYTGFEHWTVTSGTVDLIKEPGYGISCNGGSFCVDLDGSTGSGGTLVSKHSFKAGTYNISLDFSGNQRNANAAGNDSFNVLFGGSVLANIPFTAFDAGWNTLNLLATVNAGDRFSISTGSNDNIGLIIDNISIAKVSEVPLPAAAFLFAPALLGFMGLRRKAKQA